MARKLNGTTDTMTAAGVALTGAVMSMSHWAWYDNVALTTMFPIKYSGGGSTHGFLTRSDFAASTIGIEMFINGSLGWEDSAPAPSSAAWHHYLWVANRTTPLNTLYIDGVLQTLTSQGHDAGSYGNFNGNTLIIGQGNTPGRFAEVAIWDGVTITAAEAKSLSVGATPLEVHPDGLTYYAPMLGDSPEPDYSGKKSSLTLTGTTVANDPGLRSLLATRRVPFFTG